MTASVHNGRLVHLLRDIFHKLHQQKHVKCPAAKMGNDDGQIGSHPAKLIEQQVLGDHQHLRRQAHGQEHCSKPEFSGPESDPGKTVSGKRTGNHGSQRGKDRDEEGISKKGRKRQPRKSGPSLRVIGKRPSLRDHAVRGGIIFIVGFQR